VLTVIKNDQQLPSVRTAASESEIDIPDA
jgi:hypothetical protein